VRVWSWQNPDRAQRRTPHLPMRDVRSVLRTVYEGPSEKDWTGNRNRIQSRLAANPSSSGAKDATRRLLIHADPWPRTGRTETSTVYNGRRLTVLAGLSPGKGGSGLAVKGKRRDDPVHRGASWPAPLRERRTRTAEGLPGPPGSHGETKAHRAPDTRTDSKSGSLSTRKLWSGMQRRNGQWWYPQPFRLRLGLSCRESGGPQ